jgi:hypothetical protein
VLQSGGFEAKPFGGATYPMARYNLGGNRA